MRHATEVTSYSGYTYAQEPRSFLWEGQRHEVSQVESRWQTPDGRSFVVRTKEGERFRLEYDVTLDKWWVTPLLRSGPTK